LSDAAARPGRIVRLLPLEGASLSLILDGEVLPAREGESVLAAVLAARLSLRRLEFTSEERAGFCLMGACQDCWIWTETGDRLRACTTRVAAGMRLRRDPPPGGTA
jgi:D-hydroxyproline dehydrogenase subunit gamma